MAISTGEQILAADVNAAIPQYISLAGSDDIHAAADGVWGDWDISGIVPVNTKYVEVAAEAAIPPADIDNWVGVRKNGSALVRIVGIANDTWETVTIQCEVDSNRIIEIFSDAVTNVHFSIIGYWIGL